jgi:hypothetical protein
MVERNRPDPAGDLLDRDGLRAFADLQQRYYSAVFAEAAG